MSADPEASEQAPRQVLADISVLISPLTDEEIAEHGLATAEQAISVISIAELHKGVLLADRDDQRGERLQRLATVEARHEPLPLDADAARNLGRYMYEAKRDQRSLRVRDAIIAATARAHDLAVLTRDADFARFDAELIRLAAA